MIIKNAELLTSKPVMYVSNVNDDVLEVGNNFSNLVEEYALKKGLKSIKISTKIEEELSSFDDIKEKEDLMKSLGIKKSGLDLFISEGFKLLNLITFFTSGPKESRAWTLPKGSPAPDAGEVIHSDFKRGFIAAEGLQKGPATASEQLGFEVKVTLSSRRNAH